MSQVPFAFEYESERPNGHSVNSEKSVKLPTQTVLSPNYHSAVQLTFPNWPNGNSVTVLLPNCHSAVQTITQKQMEPKVFRKH